MNGVTLNHRSVNGMLASEVIVLDNDNKRNKVIAHYTETDS